MRTIRELHRRAVGVPHWDVVAPRAGVQKPPPEVRIVYVERPAAGAAAPAGAAQPQAVVSTPAVLVAASADAGGVQEPSVAFEQLQAELEVEYGQRYDLGDVGVDGEEEEGERRINGQNVFDSAVETEPGVSEQVLSVGQRRGAKGKKKGGPPRPGKAAAAAAGAPPPAGGSTQPDPPKVVAGGATGAPPVGGIPVKMTRRQQLEMEAALRDEERREAEAAVAKQVEDRRLQDLQEVRQEVQKSKDSLAEQGAREAKRQKMEARIAKLEAQKRKLLPPNEMWIAPAEAEEEINGGPEATKQPVEDDKTVETKQQAEEEKSAVESGTKQAYEIPVPAAAQQAEESVQAKDAMETAPPQSAVEVPAQDETGGNPLTAAGDPKVRGGSKSSSPRSSSPRNGGALAPPATAQADFVKGLLPDRSRLDVPAAKSASKFSEASKASKTSTDPDPSSTDPEQNADGTGSPKLSRFPPSSRPMSGGGSPMRDATAARVRAPGRNEVVNPSFAAGPVKADVAKFEAEVDRVDKAKGIKNLPGMGRSKDRGPGAVGAKLHIPSSSSSSSGASRRKVDAGADVYPPADGAQSSSPSSVRPAAGAGFSWGSSTSSRGPPPANPANLPPTSPSNEPSTPLLSNSLFFGDNQSASSHDGSASPQLLDGPDTRNEINDTVAGDGGRIWDQTWDSDADLDESDEDSSDGSGDEDASSSRREQLSRSTPSWAYSLNRGLVGVTGAARSCSPQPSAFDPPAELKRADGIKNANSSPTSIYPASVQMQAGSKLKSPYIPGRSKLDNFVCARNMFVGQHKEEVQHTLGQPPDQIGE